MSGAVVIDASVALTSLRLEAGFREVDRRFRQWLETGARLVVPSHFWLEVSNALLRRHRMSGSDVFGSIHRLDELLLETAEVDRPLVLLAVDLADQFELTAYDATYLALAEILDGVLYSSDAQLLTAAGSRGLGVAGSGGHRLSEHPAPYGTPRRPTWPDYAGTSAYLAKLRAEARQQA